jgi:uncharacterized protein (TIRG00374 family)
MKRFKVLFLVLGLGGFVFLLDKVGFRNIAENLELVGWNFSIICILQLVSYLFQNVAWAFELRGTFKDVGFSGILKARLAGEALNGIIPLGNMGGEPVKVYLLKEKASRTEIIASLILDKTVYAVGSILYILVGLAAAVLVLGAFSFKLRLVAILFIALMAYGLVCFIRKKDFFESFFRKLEKWGIATAFVKRRIEAIIRMDERIASFYRLHKMRFLLSVFCHFLSKFLYAVEFYLIFKFLGLHLSFTYALCINSLAMIANTIFFFVPGHWGIAEGAQAFIFMALGLNPYDGIRVGVIRRVRQLFWTLVGLAIFFFSDPESRKAVITEKPIGEEIVEKEGA